VCASWCSFFFQAEDGIRDPLVTGVQTCALPISLESVRRELVRRAGERRRAEELQELERLGSELSTLLGGIYRGERIRVVSAAPRSEERRVGKESRAEWRTQT